MDSHITINTAFMQMLSQKGFKTSQQNPLGSSKLLVGGSSIYKSHDIFQITIRYHQTLQEKYYFAFH